MKKITIIMFMAYVFIIGYVFAQDNENMVQNLPQEEIIDEDPLEGLTENFEDTDEGTLIEENLPDNVYSDYDFALLNEVLLHQDPDPAEPGEYVEVRFLVTKQGNEKLENIEYEIKENYPFKVAQSDEAVKKIGDWRGHSQDDEYYILHYKLEVAGDAKEHSYPIDLIRRTGPEGSQIEIKQEYEIRVDEKKIPQIEVGKVRTSPNKLLPDYSEAQVLVDLVNIGTEDAKKTKTTLNLPEEFSNSFSNANKDMIGTIGEGDSTQAIYYIDTEEGIDKGIYNATLDVEYIVDSEGVATGNREKEKTLNVPIEVLGKPSYSIIDSEVKPEKLKTDSDENEIKLTLENVGSKDADTVSVIAQRDSTQPFDFEDRSDYIGEIKQGETGQSVFKFDIDDNADVRDHNLRFKIRSVVDNEVITEEKNVRISVDEERETQYPIVIILGIVVVLGMLYGSYKYGQNQVLIKNSRKKIIKRFN